MNPASYARHRRVAAALAILACACLPPARAAVDPKAARFYEDALTRYEKKDMAGAIIQLKNSIAIDKNQLAVHVLLGKALLAEGQAAPAEAAFTEALRLGVNRSEVVLSLARALVLQGKQAEMLEHPRFNPAGLPSSVQAQLMLERSSAQLDVGDPRAALKSVTEAQMLAPTTIEPWLAEVPLRVRARQFSEALAAVAKARAVDPNAAELHYQLGSILHVQGNIAGAVDAYGKALAVTPGHIDSRVARAGVRIDQGRFPDAAADIAELTTRAPKEPRGWFLSALLAERDGKVQSARTSLLKVTELLDPVPIEVIRFRPQLLLLNGQAHFGLGQREKAKPYFEFFQRAQPGTPVSKLLANIYLAEQNHDLAIEALEQYLRAFPADSQAMALLASAQMAKGRHARAATLMQQALRSKDAPELYTAYGLSLIGVGQPANAVTQLETAYKKDPGQTQAAFALVGLYLGSGQSAKALAVANALVAKQPTNPSFVNLLGLAKTQSRDIAGARTAFEAARQLDPTLLAAALNLARLESSAGNRPRASVVLDEVLKADERNTEAMYEKAALAERDGRADEALRWLQKAYDTAGAKDLKTSLALVDLHMRQRRQPAALKVASELSSNLPDSLPVLLALARVQLAGDDVAAARTTLTAATRVAAFNPALQTEIAMLQLAARNLAGAAYSLDKALTQAPGFLPAQVMMTEVEIRQGDAAKAEQRAQQIVKKEPKLPIGYSLLGDVAMARKQVPAAVEQYRRAHQVQASTDTFGRLFAALAGIDSKAAVQLAEQWLRAHPADAGARRKLAQVHVRTNALAAARAEYERLRALLPKDAGIANDLANVLLRLKDPAALAVAEDALALEPNDAQIIDTAGWAAFQANRLERALQLLRDARLRQPESPEIRYHLAVVLARSGRAAEARDELQVALGSTFGFDGRTDAETLLRSLK